MVRSRVGTKTQEHAAVHAVQVLDDDTIIEPPMSDVPEGWELGALLNVRNAGEFYIVTLYPEEYDFRNPERCMRFHNSARCQDFCSAWYARLWIDPRA